MPRGTTHPRPSPSSYPRRVATGARACGAEEGEGNPAAGALGAAGRGVPTVRAARTLSPDDRGELVGGIGGRRGERWGAGPPERWNHMLPSPRAAEATEEQVPVVGGEAPAAGRSVEEAARVVEALARAEEASGSAAVATTGTSAASAEPSR
jgi:hypothetical protein